MSRIRHHITQRCQSRLLGCHMECPTPLLRGILRRQAEDLCRRLVSKQPRRYLMFFVSANRHFPNLLECTQNNSLNTRRIMLLIVNRVVFIAREQIREVSIAQINKLLTIIIIYYSVLSFYSGCFFILLVPSIYRIYINQCIWQPC